MRVAWATLGTGITKGGNALKGEELEIQKFMQLLKEVQTLPAFSNVTYNEVN